MFMNGPEGIRSNTESRAAQNLGMPHPRTVGSPLPMGGAAVPPPAQAPPPGRSLTTPPPASDEDDLPGSLQKAFSALRATLPFVQRILPLLDGNVASTVVSLLTPRQQTTPPQAQVNLAPLEDGLAELHTQNRELTIQIAEQNTSLKRVEDQLELVREATDRNTLEQQELLDDLKTVGRKVNMVVVIALSLLSVSVLINLILFLHIQRLLP